MATRNRANGRREHDIHDAELDRQAAVLRAEGKTYPQIAETMGCSLSTAHGRVQKALRAVPSEAVEDLRRIWTARYEEQYGWLREAALEHAFVVASGKVTDERDRAVLAQLVTAMLRVGQKVEDLHGLAAPKRQVIEVVTEDVVDRAIAALEAEIAERAET